MKIATFNVNSIRSRLNIVTDWMQKSNTDILCLQETKAQDCDFPEQAFTDAGYHVIFKGEKSYNGVAIISRHKIDKHSFGFDDQGPTDETRLVYAKIGPLHIVNTYVPQGRAIDHEMYKYKLEWFKRLRKYFEKNFSTRMKVVWVGDMNVAPKAMDIHNAEKQQEHVCYHIDVRHAFADVVEWGFIDVFRKHHPEPGLYSFFDYRVPNAMKRGMGWRIDHIMATSPLANKSINAEIDLAPRAMVKPSDHAVMFAEFAV